MNVATIIIGNLSYLVIIITKPKVHYWLFTQEEKKILIPRVIVHLELTTAPLILWTKTMGNGNIDKRSLAHGFFGSKLTAGGPDLSGWDPIRTGFYRWVDCAGRQRHTWPTGQYHLLMGLHFEERDGLGVVSLT